MPSWWNRIRGKKKEAEPYVIPTEGKNKTIKNYTKGPAPANSRRAFPVRVVKPNNKNKEYTRYVPKYTAEQKKKRDAINLKLTELRKFYNDLDKLDKKCENDREAIKFSIDNIKQKIMASNALTNAEKKNLENSNFEGKMILSIHEGPEKVSGLNLTKAKINTYIKGLRRNISNTAKATKKAYHEASKSNYGQARNLLENMSAANLNNESFDKKKKELYKLLGRRSLVGSRKIKREQENALRKNLQNIMNIRRNRPMVEEISKPGSALNIPAHAENLFSYNPGDYLPGESFEGAAANQAARGRAAAARSASSLPLLVVPPRT